MWFNSVSFESKVLKPKKTIIINDIKLIVTITSCVFSTFLTPKTLRRTITNKAKSAIIFVKSGPNGISSIMPKLPKIDLAIIGEPTLMDIAIASCH